MGNPGNKRNLETTAEQRFEEDIEYFGSIPVGSGERLRGVRRVFGVSGVLGSLKLNMYLEGKNPSGILSTPQVPLNVPTKKMTRLRIDSVR